MFGGRGGGWRERRKRRGRSERCRPAAVGRARGRASVEQARSPGCHWPGGGCGGSRRAPAQIPTARLARQTKNQMHACRSAVAFAVALFFLVDSGRAAVTVRVTVRVTTATTTTTTISTWPSVRLVCELCLLSCAGRIWPSPSPGLALQHHGIVLALWLLGTRIALPRDRLPGVSTPRQLEPPSNLPPRTIRTPTGGLRGRLPTTLPCLRPETGPRVKQARLHEKHTVCDETEPTCPFSPPPVLNQLPTSPCRPCPLALFRARSRNQRHADRSATETASSTFFYKLTHACIILHTSRDYSPCSQ